ncbi:MAG: carboxypeptidase-like regulatory domain-containing protein [Gemmatimonadaceae bacterium]
MPIGLGFRIQAQSVASNTGILEMQVPRAGVLPLVLGIPAAVADKRIVEGSVLNSEGGPVSGARVRSFATSAAVATNARGRFALADVPAGSQQLEITAAGFYPEHVTLLLDTPASYEVRATLQRVTLLDAVRVTARRGDGSLLHREFDDRYAHGFGRYLTAEDMAKRPFFRVTDALIMLPGMITHVTRDGSRVLTTKSARGASTLLGMQIETRSSSQGGKAVTGPPAPNYSSCGGIPAVFIDGSQATLEELDLIPPGRIYGIEVYREGDSVPARYTAGSMMNCGAIIVWTK